METLAKRIFRFFILATIIKNLGKIKVSRKYKQMKTPALHSWAHGTKFTGDPLCGSPDVADTAIYSAADAMQAAYSLMQTNPSKANTASVKSLRRTLLTALDLNANYLEGKANAASIAAGDIEVGINVINRIGFQVAGKGTAHRIAGIVDAGIGWVHVREVRIKTGSLGHAWEGGICTAKGVPPTSFNTWFGLECDVIFDNIPSGSVIGYRHASIVPAVSKTGTTAGVTPALTPVKSAAAKTASLVPVSKSKHPVYDFSKAITYQFGDWRYTVVS
jgi:hypothetical protein